MARLALIPPTLQISPFAPSRTGQPHVVTLVDKTLIRRWLYEIKWDGYRAMGHVISLG